VHAFQRDELFAATLKLEQARHDVCWLSLDTAADDDARRRRGAWLGRDL